MSIRKPISRQSQFQFRRFFSPQKNRKPGRIAMTEPNPTKTTKPRVVICVDLVKGVPEEHQKFLADMVWVHEEDDVCIESEEGLKNCKLIAVHAGLEKDKNVEEQLKLLKDKETGLAKIEGLCGRKNVWDIPKLTEQPTILVSGYHGKLHVQGLRLIIDEGGGLEDNPLAAIVLPSMRLVRYTDSVASSLHQLS